MVRVGIAGIGFMGWIHWLAYRRVPGVQVTAISTRSEKKLSGDWTGIQGNFGPPGEKVDLTGVRTYRELDEMLADPAIDVVDLCLPPHDHAPVTLKALAAGKHVFCEKPMALTTGDCGQMVAAAEKAGRQLLIGHVLPFFPEYAWALAAIRRGDFGRLLGGSFKRVISDPLWLPDFYDPHRVGGPLVDLHVHDAHFIRLLFGQPTAVVSQGRMRGDVVEYCQTQFRFADASLAVEAAGGVVRQQGRAFTHGFEIHLERATLQYEFAVVGGRGELLMPLTVFTSDGRTDRPRLGDGDPLRAFEAEIGEVVRAVGSGQPSPFLSGSLARDAIALCHAQTESVRWQRTVAVGRG